MPSVRHRHGIPERVQHIFPSGQTNLAIAVRAQYGFPPATQVKHARLPQQNQSALQPVDRFPNAVGALSQNPAQNINLLGNRTAGARHEVNPRAVLTPVVE